MAKDEFRPFSNSLNPFRSLDRQGVTPLDVSLAATVGLSDHVDAEGAAESQRQSLFLRVVQVHSTPRRD